MLISIITVVYNDRIGLQKTIDSLNKQIDAPAYEHLVIDGNSSDGTPSWLKANETAQRKWISEPDKGLYDAMNKGIELAQGEYLMFLNAGDSFAQNDVLQNVGRVLEIEKPDFAHGLTLDVDTDNLELGARRLSLKEDESLTWKSFKWGMKVCHQAMFVKRTIVQLYDLQYQLSADFDWSVRCLKNAQNISALDFPIVHFQKGGLTDEKRIQSLTERFKIMSKHYGLWPTVLRHLYFPFRLFGFWIRNNRI